MAYIRRILAKKLENTTKTFSATYLSGARQCGKSTLVRHLLSLDDAHYLTFDTTTVRTMAKKDPEAFIASLPTDKLNIIDEVQRVPAVNVLLKKAVDERRFEGQGKALFLLTGSANIFGVPKLAKAMVGRMAVLTLHPFSAAEIHNSDVNFIEKLWKDTGSFKNYERADLTSIIKNATFPEIALHKDIDQSVWMDSYIDTILDRDAAEFAKIRKPELVYQLLVSLCSRVGSLMNNDNIMKETGFNQITYEKYKSFCNATFLTFEIQPWSRPNKLNKRFVKSKKIYFTDTNLLCFLMRCDISEVYAKDPSLMGHLFENFIATEIMKSISALPGKFHVSHFNPVRGDGKETDFVIEKDNGETIAIEVKLDSSLNENDFKNITLCRDTIGSKFKKGIVLYTGEVMAPFSDKLWAVPVNYLWE
ncbi:MAG: ATP-binding protein [Treponema sp.]|nr:ATP-binding protein [Treponema sp.]